MGARVAGGGAGVLQPAVPAAPAVGAGGGGRAVRLRALRRARLHPAARAGAAPRHGEPPRRVTGKPTGCGFDPHSRR